MFGIPRPTLPLPPGTLLGGRYRVGACLSSAGGVPGNSYLALDDVDGQRVVVKLLGAMPFELDRGLIESSLEPFRAVDAAFLPRLGELLVERVDDHFCALLVQEHLPGESLAHRVARLGPLPADEARRLARRLLELLRYLQAERLPIIHGDIQPHNLLLGPEEAALALVDMAPPKAVARDWAVAGFHKAGWGHAVDRSFGAPEALMGAPSPRSDLYGAGACVAFALTGRTPGSIRDHDPRGALRGGLDRLRVPAGMAVLLEHLLEPTVERRLHGARQALEVQRDPATAPRIFSEREPGEEVFWQEEPSAWLGSWASRLGAGLAVLVATPLLLATVVVASPAFGLGGWLSGAVRLGLGIVTLLAAAWTLRAALRLWLPLGRTRLQAMGRCLRYDSGQGWVEIPWFSLHSQRYSWPVLVLYGSWSDGPGTVGRPRSLWLAPVYRRSLRQLDNELRLRLRKARERSSSSLREAGSTPLGWQRAGLPAALLVGLSLTGLGMVTARWGQAEDSGPRLGSLRSAVAGATRAPLPAPRSDGPAPSLAELAAERPGQDQVDGEPGDLPFQDAMARGQALGQHSERERARRAFEQALGQPEDPQRSGSRRCPAGMEQRVLVAADRLPTACLDEHGTMLRVDGGRAGDFLVDWTEVTVADYARCVVDGACEAPHRGTGCHGGDATRGSYPVNCISRAQAEAWCAWAGRRLCSYEQHMKAATGRSEAVYPWGDAPPECERVIMDGRGGEGVVAAPGCGRGGPWPVGSRVPGVSPVGAVDLSGNLAEWVAGEPVGVMGGSYMDRAPEELQAGSLRPLPPDLPVPDVGFRCCRGVY